MAGLDVDVRDTFAGLKGPYSTIVADPPWQYVKTTRGESGDGRRYADDHYSTLTMAEIAELPVADLAAENAHLYLWTTNPRLYGDRGDLDGMNPAKIMRAWGFEYRTTLTWVKQGAPGMGAYFRINTEHVLFGIRGSATVPPTQREGNVIIARKGGHSQKPAAFMDLVERVSPGPYLELFCRAQRMGWDSWGHGYETKEAI